MAAKNWCFTDFDLIDWENLFKLNPNIVYLCYGFETCPLTEKSHYQGWLQLKTKKALSYLKAINMTAHWEKCKGNEAQNDKYCKKDGTFFKFGEFTKMGQRTDLDALRKYSATTASTLSIARKYFPEWLKWHKAILSYQLLERRERSKKDRDVHVTYVCGPTGCGKTRWCINEIGDKDYYKIQGWGLKWFDGYEGEEILLIDEYSMDVKITKLLSILDRYMLRLPIKCSFAYACWTKVYITSNFSMESCHIMATEAHKAALKRRIHVIVDCWKNPTSCKIVQGGQGNTKPALLKLPCEIVDLTEDEEEKKEDPFY